MSSLVRTVQPTSEPVSLADAKLWCRVDNTSEDDVISTLISAAREQVETDMGRQLGAQTWVWNVDQHMRHPTMSTAVSLDLRWGVGSEAWEWPWFIWGRRYPALRSPVTPVEAVTAVTYRLDATDVEFDETTIRIGGDRDLIFEDGFPFSDEQRDAITITMTCGADASNRAIQAIKMLIVHWYENRVPVQMGTGRGIVEIPLAYQILVGGSRSWSL